MIFDKHQMLTISQSARLLGVSRQKIYFMIDEGRLRAFQFGFTSRRFIPRSDLKEVMSGTEVMP
ncbi:helix-turn-helix domain-containing protein [Pelobacter propionicus]|uniref:helix-turn-helix domain-containing protein n=1 Tax=Pelobacter propionicus TaxID=29543 RepID=UPI0003039B28|nr:helix-turn-helix domain-containing protein [Pelobacter propionicus]